MNNKMKQTNKENKQGTSYNVEKTNSKFIGTDDFRRIFLIEAILPGEVKEWGSSAHIPFQKKFIGKKAKIIIYSDITERRNKWKNKKN